MLVIITANEDDASKVYVKKKIQKLKENDIEVHHEDLGICSSITLKSKLKLYAELEGVKGILLQLPLHDTIKDMTQEFIDMIPPNKDVDCLTTYNQGKIALGDNSFLPCTTQAVFDMIVENTDNVSDEIVHVVGRSTLVTKPLIIALINAGYSVRNWNSKHRCDEIIYVVEEDSDKYKVHFVSGIGVANYFEIEEYMGCEICIYDIGMNRDENGKLCGDVKQSQNVKFQTPVPNGVGVKTVENVIKNYRKLEEL